MAARRPSKSALPNFQARNPLGVIGLFVWLVYGVAGAVVTISSAHLSNSQIWVMVAFIVLFPPLLLYVFHNLVTNHPRSDRELR